MGLSSEGPPTTLRPGQSESLVVQLRVPLRSDRVTVTLSSVGAVPTDGSTRPIDWTEFEQDVKPRGPSTPRRGRPIFASVPDPNRQHLG